MFACLVPAFPVGMREPKGTKMMRRAAAALLAVAMTCGIAQAQDGKWSTVRIATEGAYVPWNFTGAGGKLEGYEIDLAHELCTRMKVKCEIVAQDFDGLIPALNAKKFDAIMAGVSITAKRLEVIDFSRSYADAGNGILVAKGSEIEKALGPVTRINLDSKSPDTQKAIETLKAALKGKTIGVQGSTTHAVFAEQNLGKSGEIREYKTTEQHDLDLAAGRIDAVVADATALQGTLGKPEFKDYTLAGPSFSGGVLGRGVGAGLRKDDKDLKAMFDAAINAAIADGTVKRLSEKWFKVDVTPQS
jgi:octopine/nopaline transport system substrate-binding protein